MQISGEGPAFGKMQMVVGRGENRQRGRVCGADVESWGIGRERGLPGSIVLTLGGLKTFLCWFCLSAKL